MATSTSSSNEDFGPERGRFSMIGCLILCTILAAVTAGYFAIQRATSPKTTFFVDSVVVYPFNISSSTSSFSSYQITANWNITLYVKNRFNPTPSYYDDIRASIFLKNQNVSNAIVSRFLVGQHKSKMVQINLSTSSGYLNQTVAEDVIAERVSEPNGTVTFSLKLNGSNVYPGEDGEWKQKMVVLCDDLKVGFVSNDGFGKLLGGRAPCTRHVNW